MTKYLWLILIKKINTTYEYENYNLDIESYYVTLL